MITPERMAEIEIQVCGNDARDPWDEQMVGAVCGYARIVNEIESIAEMARTFGDASGSDLRRCRRLIRRELGLTNPPNAADMIRECITLVEDSHVDYDANEDNESPDDMAAHVNGLLHRRLTKALAMMEGGE